jgi:hypothetical protein
VSVANILTITGILLTFASVTFAAVELRRSRRNSQAEFLFNIITWYLGDQALRNFFYKLDYNTWKFDEKKFPGSRDEPNLDKMLFVFDLLERFVASENIALSDLSMIAFEASRVVHNPEVERYLTWLDEEYRQAGYPTPAYEGARRLARRLITTGLASGFRAPSGMGGETVT